MATLLRKCSQLGKLGRIGSTLFPSFPAMPCASCVPNLLVQTKGKLPIWEKICHVLSGCKLRGALHAVWLSLPASILHVPSNHLQKVRREGTIFNACPPCRHHAICTPLSLFTSYEIGFWKDILRWTFVTLSRCCVQ